MLSKDNILQQLNSIPTCNFVNDKWIFTGKVSVDPSPIIRKAYRHWKKQGDRCNDPKHNRYRYYGAKGVKRVWDSRTFVNWFINQILEREVWSAPVVSRSNDVGDYQESNCQLLENLENIEQMSSERITFRERVVQTLIENQINQNIINKIKEL